MAKTTKAEKGGKPDEKKRAAGRYAHEARMALPLSRLAGVREGRGWSKAKSADAAGMDVTTYSRIERCVVNPFEDQAQRIAEAFGVAVDDLTAPATGGTVEGPTLVGQVEPPALPEKVDPLVELGQRVRKLEDDLAATMASLGALKASHKVLVGRVEQLGDKAAAVEDIGTPGMTGTLEQVDAGNGTTICVSVYAPGALGGDGR